MDPNSQASGFLMIPFAGRIQPQSEACDDSPKQSYSSFLPSFLPNWSPMRAGPGIPPIVPESPPSFRISEVPSEPDMSDDDMSVDKPLACRVCKYIYSECQELNWWAFQISTLNVNTSDDEMSPSSMGPHKACRLSLRCN
jgi:hypothetical protein